ncbi:MAG: MFS transporter [Thermotogota bacterium]
MTKQERSWVLYDWANSAFSVAITTAIFPLFFKAYAASDLPNNVSTAYWGYWNSMATFIIALLAPILGTIADYKNRKKRFLAFFWIMGITGTGLLSMINEGQWVMALTIYVISLVGFSGANVFYDAFLVDVTTDERMDWISSSGFAWGYLGSTIPFIISIVFILKPSMVGLSGDIAAQKLSFVITALWWGIFTIPLLLNVKQKNFIPPSSTVIKDSFERLGKTIGNIKNNKNIFIFLIAYFFYIDGVGTIIKMATSYGADVGIATNDLLIILLVTQFVAFPFALIYGKLAHKVSAKFMLFIGIGIYTILTIYAYFINSTFDYWVLAMLVASSQGGIQALSRSLYGKLIPKEKSAEFYGFYNIFGKFAAVLGPFLVGFFSQISGSSRTGIISIVVLFVIGGLVLTRVKERRV